MAHRPGDRPQRWGVDGLEIALARFSRRQRRLGSPRARPGESGGDRRRRRRLLDPLLADAARLGRRRARRARRPHERLDVPLGGPRRPAAQLALADEDDDGERRAVPVARRTRSGSRPGGARSGRCGSRPREERMEEIARQAGWAKTFGLPLELISPAEAQELFPPMSTDGVLGAAYLPTDGYIDPSQLTFALAEGARRRGAEIATNTRVTGDPRAARPRRRASRPTAARSRRRSSSTPAACSRARSARSPGSTSRSCRWRTSTSCCSRPGLPLEMPTMRDPSLLVYFRPESGGLIMGGYERHCAPWSLDGIPADFNGEAARGGLAALRGAACRTRSCACPRSRRWRS